MNNVLNLPTALEGVSFRSTELPPPSNVYIGKDDALFITTYNSATSVRVDVRGRFLRADGVSVPLEMQQSPNTDRSAKTTIVPLGEGFLLNLTAFLGSGTAKRGRCYVVVGLCQGLGNARLVHTIIAQGYVGNGVNQAWPGNRLEQPTEGPGAMRAIIGTNPAANAQISETVPTGARWRVVCAQLILQASAAAANRLIFVILSDGVNDFFSVAANRNQVANEQIGYVLSAGMPYETVPYVNSQPLGLPSFLLMPAAYTFRTAVNNMDAGDDWAAPVLFIEEWIEP